ncbi:MAG: hypothetical protein LBR15_02560 [Methanobrevibacter sp.]|jgi:hypothetical protein|nr:hypothetical protein [Candidatus Methanovirga australis]
MKITKNLRFSVIHRFSVILNPKRAYYSLQIRRTKKDIRRIILNIIVDEVFTDAIKSKIRDGYYPNL